MGICEMCRAIPLEPLLNTDIIEHVHHLSVKGLEIPATNGCRICTLFHSAIASAPHRKTYMKVIQKLGVPTPHRKLVSYHVGRDGHSCLFDVETTGMMFFFIYPSACSSPWETLCIPISHFPDDL